MKGLLSTLQFRARAISLAAAAFYLAAIVAAMLPATASAEDEAFAAAVRAGIICTTPDAPALPAAGPAPSHPHTANDCGLCITGCAFGGAAPPPAIAGLAHPHAAVLAVAGPAFDGDAPGLRRPASDVAARAPPAADRA